MDGCTLGCTKRSFWLKRDNRVCLPACRPDVFDGFDVFLARDHFSKHGVLAVEMGGADRGDEKLGTVAVWEISEGL